MPGSSTIKRALILAGVFGTLASTQRAAVAQPDPFLDYETSKAAGEEPPQLPPEEPAPPLQAAPVGPAEPAEGDATGLQLPFEKGAWMVGGRTLFSYTGTRNELPSGSDQSNRTLFLRLTPTVGYFIDDNIQLSASVGWLFRSLSREDDVQATESAWLFEAAGHYVLPMGKRFALVPGLGLGFYLGGSDRKLRLAGEEVNESTSTRGFSAAFYLGVAYQVATNWQVRSGVALSTLLGTETIRDSSLSTSTAHFGLPVELYYTF